MAAALREEARPQAERLVAPLAVEARQVETRQVEAAQQVDQSSEADQPGACPLAVARLEERPRA